MYNIYVFIIDCAFLYYRVYLNVCFSYASRYEITDTVQSLVDGSHDATILPT